MKNFKTIISIALMGIFLLPMGGCKKYFDVGSNPNQVTDPPINTFLSTVTSKSALNAYRVANINGYFTQYFANPSAGGSTDTYQITDYTSTWDAIYFAMADLNDMKKKAIAVSSSEHEGVADLLLAFNLNFVTDMWGKGPYTEAFSGTVLTPKYDDEETLYNTSLSLVNEGLTLLAKTDSKINLSPTYDLIYKGDRLKWIKFGNLLKARLLNKISKKSNYNPAAVLAAVDLSFQNNADDALMSNFLGNNPWADVAIANIGLNLDGWLSKQFINSLNGINYGVLDPRISKITEKTVTGTYVGTPNGTGNIGPAANTVKDECYISLNSPLSGKTSALNVATYSELKFIEAEAAFRLGGANLSRAYNAYLQGIKANMDKLGVDYATTGSDGYNYLTNSTAVAQSDATLTLDLIFKEKYIANYLNPETWNDARRYDYKYSKFEIPANAGLSTFIRRVDFPSGERSKNSANVPAAVPLSDNLWWDKP